MINTTNSLALEKLTKALEKAKIELDKQVKTFAEHTDALTSQAYELEVLESKKASISVEIEEAKRRAEAELKLLLLENEDMVLNDLLKSRGLALISKDEVSGLQKDLEAEATKAREAFDAGRAEGIKHTEAQTLEERLTLLANHRVEVAEKDASIKSLQEQKDQLVEVNNQLQESLKAEREARVEVAKNTAQPTINVTH